LAGLCAGLALVTRPNGVALAIVPPLALVRDAWKGGSPSWRGAALGVLLAIVPVGLFLWHNAARTGDALYCLRAIHGWGYDATNTWHNLWVNTYGKLREFPALPWHGFHQSKIDFLVMALALSLWLLGLRVMTVEQAAYSAAILLIPLLTKDDLMSYARCYALLAWPLATVPVLFVRRALRCWAFTPTVLILLALQADNVAAFVNWHWVG
jgi:hypothetical protein